MVSVISSFSGSLVITSKTLLILPVKFDVFTVAVKLPCSPGFISAELAEMLVSSGQVRKNSMILRTSSPLFTKVKVCLITSPFFAETKSYEVSSILINGLAAERLFTNKPDMLKIIRKLMVFAVLI